MEYVLYGFFGAMALVIVFATGFVLGWQIHKGSRVVTARELEERERRQLIAEQEAFRMLQNYSVERAYGMVDDAEPMKEE